MSEYSYYSESKSVVPVPKQPLQQESGESEYESFEESQEQEQLTAKDISHFSRQQPQPPSSDGATSFDSDGI